MIASIPDSKSLSLLEQIAQMVVVRASGYWFDHQIQYPVWEPTASVLQHWIQDLKVGGVILLGGSAAEVGLRSHLLQAWATVPLLIAADIEEGVGQRFSGATWFPPPMALGAIASKDFPKAQAYAKQMGAITAREALAIGINWVLAPVVDVNNNPANPVINIRAFGETPEIVSQLATAFIRGAQGYPVLTTAKHFPGHGDTATDSHLELPVMLHSQSRLAAVELPPFIAAIAAGVDAVMSAHLQIPALDPTFPATLSHPILTGELRQRLAFEGLIVTDALVMGAIANRYGNDEAAVLAVAAGADVLLMPLDPEGAIAAVGRAVETGRISPEQIQASVERIWKAKRRVCSMLLEGDTSHAWEKFPLPLVQQTLTELSQPDAIASTATLLRDSMQVHRPHPSRINRSTRSKHLRNLILVDDALNCDFLAKHTPAIAFPQALGYELQLIDNQTPDLLFSSDPKSWRPTLLQLFIRGNPFRGSAGLTQTAQAWVQFLVETDQLQALLIYGSPYGLEPFLTGLSPDVPYGFTYGQMATAQAIALEALFHRFETLL